MAQDSSHGTARALVRQLTAAPAALECFTLEREDLAATLDDLIGMDNSAAAQSATQLRARLEALEASVTFIGQVKSGKTTLVNAMVGVPDLLPADVNPWTSVVTSLHLGPERAQTPFAARFTFFEPEDWEKLTRTGGRIGELAGRSGAEDEAEKVRQQIEAMQEKTRRRLGRKFELLLGTCHEYGRFDKELIERYVCLGDAFDSEAGDAQGRFADVTKSAELCLPRPRWPLTLTLRDTPGVNDTFMMREQITISAIRDSGLCVVVLSAHQALSAVDMALIRLISTVKSREVVFFVNRIDELADPVAAIGEIRANIRQTLRAHHGPEEAEIVFGSAMWATLALSGRLNDMDKASAEGLLSYAEVYLGGLDEMPKPVDLVWQLSGVPALYEALWQRVAEGQARSALHGLARQAMNLATGLDAAAEAEALRTVAVGSGQIDAKAMTAELAVLQTQVTAQFRQRFAGEYDKVVARTGRGKRSFVDRATAELLRHLEIYGEYAPWTYDPAGLRLLMKSAYRVFVRGVSASAEDVGQSAARGVAAIYARALDRAPESLPVQPPVPPRLPPPVLLSQTIALDLKGTWWRRWWSRRRGYKAFAADFHDMIEAETQPIVAALIETHCQPAEAAMLKMLDEFFADQHALLADLARPRTRPVADRDDDRAQLKQMMARLTRLAA